MTNKFKERETVYAVIRLDLYQDDDEDRFTVKEIVWTKELAQEEVVRLNQLNEDKKCRYFSQMTRLFPPGKSAGN